MASLAKANSKAFDSSTARYAQC